MTYREFDFKYWVYVPQPGTRGSDWFVKECLMDEYDIL